MNHVVNQTKEFHQWRLNSPRRKALLAGTATAGSVFGASCSGIAQQTRTTYPAPLPPVWGEEFLMQWTPPDDVPRDLTPGPQPIRISSGAAGFRMPRAGARPGAYGETAPEGAAPQPQSIGDVVRGIREAGYTACECGGNTFNSVTDEQIRELHAALKQYDVEFYTIHVWTNLTHPDPETQARNIQSYITNIEAAERVGIPNIVMHTGGADTNQDKPHPQNWSRWLWELAVANTKKVVAATPGSKIDLCFEAVNSHNQNTPQSHVRLKEDVGSDRVKVTLDPTNMYHPGVYFRNSELINMCFELLGEDIKYAHAKDISWTSMVPGLAEGAIIGEGIQDYELYLAHLSRMKSPRCLLIEHLRGAEAYEQSHTFVKETAKRIGVKIYGA